MHSGSHDQKFDSRLNESGELEIGKGTFSSDRNSSHSGGYTASILLMPNFDGSFRLLQVNKIHYEFLN